jgi:HEAT repeat protein
LKSVAELEAEFKASTGFPGRRMDIIRGAMDLILDVDCQELEEFLTRVVRDEPDSIVRHEAVFVIGALVSFGAFKGDHAYETILEASRSEESVVVRHESVEALANFRRMESLPALKRALGDPVEDVSATARISLERLSNHEKSPCEVRAAAADLLRAAIAAGATPTAS